jgi:hypothetical protein
MREFGWVLLSMLVGSAGGCAADRHDPQLAQLRSQLKAAMQTAVDDDHERDAQSRLLAEVVDRDAVRGLTRPEVRAAFGPGNACTLDVCKKNSFSASDWYYEIGVKGPKVKQLPLLLFGFDPHERAVRVYTLTTH